MVKKLLTLEIKGLIISKYIDISEAGEIISKPKPIVSQYRVVNIISSTNELPSANVGETIRITVETHCKIDHSITKQNVPVSLLVDGIIADTKNSSGGFVTFNWIAAAVPPLHTICAVVRPTVNCKATGKDCKKIRVSSTQLSLTEQKAKESAAFREQTELLKQRRELLRRQLITPTIVTTLDKVITPETILPTILSIPTEPIVPKPKLTGKLIISNPPVTFEPFAKVNIFIDNVLTASTNSFPKELTDISIGQHKVYLKSGNRISTEKTITISSAIPQLLSFT